MIKVFLEFKLALLQSCWPLFQCAGFSNATSALGYHRLICKKSLPVNAGGGISDGEPRLNPVQVRQGFIDDMPRETEGGGKSRGNRLSGAMIRISFKIL